MSIKKQDMPLWAADYLEKDLIAWPSPAKKEIVRRLICRSEEMRMIYDEIEEQLTLDEAPIKKIESDTLLYMIIRAAVYCNPEKITIIESESGGEVKRLSSAFSTGEIRQKLKDLEKLDRDIAKTSEKLISMLNARKEIRRTSTIDSKARLNFYDLIHEAGKKINGFNRHIFPKIKEAGFLNCNALQYPSLTQILEALVVEMGKKSELDKSGVNLETVLNSQKTSPMDYVCYLLEDIRLKKACGRLPRGFCLTNKALLTITRCVLDLADDSLSEDYITDARARLKKGQRISKKEI